MRQKIYFIIGTAWTIVGICFMVTSGSFGLLFAIFFGITAAPFFYVSLTSVFAEKFADVFYYPRKYIAAAPEICSGALGKIKREEYDAAIAELREIIAKEPDNAFASAILANLLIDELKNYHEGSEIIERYFACRRKIADEDVKMLMLYSDAALETGRETAANDLLQRELLQQYCEADKKSITARLAVLQRR